MGWGLVLVGLWGGLSEWVEAVANGELSADASVVRNWVEVGSANLVGSVPSVVRTLPSVGWVAWVRD